MKTTPGRAVSFSGAFDDPGLDDEHTIEWDLGDGTFMMDTLSFSHAYDDAGVYTVTLTVTDDDGGVGTDTALVDVKHLVYLPVITRASQP
jgi:PKD repeat protein